MKSLFAAMNDVERKRAVHEITRLVFGNLAVPATPEGQEMAARVINRILDTGDSVWHAVATLTGKRCHCFECAPTESFCR